MEQIMTVSSDLIVNFFLEHTELDHTILLPVMTSSLLNSRDYSCLIQPIVAFVPRVLIS